MASDPEYADLTGEELSALAYATPPIQPTGSGPAIVALVWIMSILTTTVISLRIWARTQRLDAGQRWGVEDYLCVIGFLPFVPAGALGILAANYGLGARDVDVNELLKIRAREYALLYEMVYYAASTITKVAIAATILRICVKKRYKYIIWTNMIIMGLVSTGSMLFVLTDCRPFAANWNKRLGKCSEEGFMVISYLGTSIQVVTDWTCAITPFFIVRDLQMARRVKISVICVLGLGVFASFAAMMRLVFYQYIDLRKYPNDELYNHAPLIIWSELEGGFAIIAASLPALRKLFGRFFRGSSAGSRAKPTSSNALERSGLRGTQLTSLSPQGKSRTMVSVGGGKWDRLSDEHDTSSRIHIIKQTEVCINESTPSELEADVHGTNWRDNDSEKIGK